MNVRKKLSEKLYLMGQSKLTKRIVVPTVITTGIVLGCSLVVDASQPKDNTTYNKVKELSSFNTFDMIATPSGITTDTLKHIDTLLEESNNTSNATSSSISKVEKIEPLVTADVLQENRRLVTHEATGSAVSDSQNTDKPEQTINTPVPTSTITVVETESPIEPATPQGIIADAHIKEHNTYKKISNLEDRVDTLTEKNKKLEKELAKYKKEEKKKKEAKKKEHQITSLHLNSYDVRKTSGANAHTLNVLLNGTYLEGYGELFHELENKYGINALFSIGNSILETGWGGDNWLARNNNNIYGFNTDRYFSSKEACIRYWFELISEHYVGDGLTSMYEINAKYCPPNSNWASDIKAVINRLVSKKNLTLN